MRSHRHRRQDLERAEVRLLQGWCRGPSRPPVHTWRRRPPDLVCDQGDQKDMRLAVDAPNALGPYAAVPVPALAGAGVRYR